MPHFKNGKPIPVVGNDKENLRALEASLKPETKPEASKATVAEKLKSALKPKKSATKKDKK